MSLVNCWREKGGQLHRKSMENPSKCAHCIEIATKLDVAHTHTAHTHAQHYINIFAMLKQEATRRDGAQRRAEAEANQLTT